MDEPGAQPQTPELDSDVVQQIMAHCDAAALCACAETCRHWHRLVAHHATWRSLAASDFGLHDGVRDWRRAYAVCHAAARSIPPATLLDRRLPPCAVVAPLATMPPLLRPRAFACSDRRCEFGAHFPPSAAAVGVGPVSSCWCTSTGLNRHVSILLDLEAISLVTAIGIVNSPSEGFDNPVKDALAYAYLECDDAARAVAAQCSQASAEARFAADGHNNSDGHNDDDDVDMSSPLADCVHAPRTPPPPAPSAPVRTWTPMRMPAAEPVMSLRFPAYPECAGLAMVRPCAPVVCRYVRIVLLCSYNPRGHAPSLANIDCSKIQVYGAPLVGLDELRVPRGSAGDEAPRGDAGTWQPVDGPGARSGPWVHPADLLAHQLFHLQQSLS